MKRLLISLWLGGAVLYTVNTFIVTGVILPAGDAKVTLASPASEHSKHQDRDLPSWGSHLPGESEDQKIQVPTREPATLSQQSSVSNSKPENGTFPSGSTPAADQEDSLGEEPVAWARVMLAATVHSGASVSSPTVTRYPPGTELQAVRRENDWVQVLDPVTRKPGWIYEKYYLSWVDGPKPTQTALAPMDNKFSEPKRPEPMPRKSNKTNRSAKAASRVSGEAMAMYSHPRTGSWARRTERWRAAEYVEAPSAWKSGPTGRFAKKRLVPERSSVPWDPYRF
jgi:SH3 domain-containing protein